MNNKFLFDTNILIYYFNGLIDDEKIDTIFIESFNISIITKIEFLSWQKLRTDKILEKQALSFIHNAQVLPLNDTIANSVIDIRQQYKIKTPDAIIGATALEQSLTLVTNNLEDFKHLDIELMSVNLLKESI